jgi:colanic acid/amylovoran biosynthesis glycosyltransferase
MMLTLGPTASVVSTYYSGIPEIVRDGEFGFLVLERDVDALAEKAAYLVDHPELWSKMGRAGRGHVERGFSN